MRQIKFRGKKTHSHGEWVYGSLLQNSAGTCYLVDKKTAPSKIGEQYQEVVYVGQFTGLKDKNGVDIYEGDIVYHDRKETYICKWIEKYACFAFVENKEYGENFYFQKIDEDKLKVIGNIYDNKELLEEEK